MHTIGGPCPALVSQIVKLLLELLAVHLEPNIPAKHHAHFAPLLRNDSNQCVTAFGQTHRRSMSGSIEIGDILPLSQRQHDTRLHGPFTVNDHRAIVEWRILLEY